MTILTGPRPSGCGMSTAARRGAPETTTCCGSVPAAAAAARTSRSSSTPAAVALDAGAVGRVVDADQLEPPRVEHPRAARPVLHPHRAGGHQRVEAPAVDGAGDRLVVSDGPQPLALAEGDVRLAHDGGEAVLVVDHRRADERGAPGGGQPHQG